MPSRTFFTLLAAIAVCAGALGQSFECDPLGPLPASPGASCEGVTSNSAGAGTGVTATASCGFPTAGLQYVVVVANGPVAVPPFGGPFPRPASANATEVRIPIPAATNTISFDWEFFNGEGVVSGQFNDGMSIDIVTASGNLLKNLAYADTASASGPCVGTVNGGDEILPAGPQSLVTALGNLGPGSYVSVVVWNGGDDAVDSSAYIDHFVFAGASGSQTVSITNAVAPVIGFVDLSLAVGSTAITGVDDDTMHNINTTIGNTLFPAGPVRISNNGVAIAGIIAGNVDFANNPIPASGIPPGLPVSGQLGYLLPFWDDLQPQAGGANTTIWWLETEGVLFIMWKNEGHFVAVGGQQVTFEIQVFSNPSNCGEDILVQYLYDDSVFGGSQSLFDNGADATVGYVGGGVASHNVQWGFLGVPNLVPTGTVLTVALSGSDFAASSPFGAGSLQLDFGTSTCSGYVLAVTLNQGTFPAGWLFGVDIPVSQLMSEISYGAPFVGTGGSFTLGPFAGLPSGLSIYAVVLSFDAMGVFASHSNPICYPIP